MTKYRNVTTSSCSGSSISPGPDDRGKRPTGRTLAEDRELCQILRVPDQRRRRGPRRRPPVFVGRSQVEAAAGQRRRTPRPARLRTSAQDFEPRQTGRGARPGVQGDVGGVPVGGSACRAPLQDVRRGWERCVRAL